MTFKEFKNSPEKAIAELGKTIYNHKPYVITKNGVIMSAGNFEHFTSGLGWTGDYYDDCVFKLREYDLHMNDNSKTANKNR